MTQNHTPGPLLSELLSRAVVWVEDGTYIGRASDDVEVQLGMVGDEDRMERYLTACPTPESW